MESLLLYGESDFLDFLLNPVFGSAERPNVVVAALEMAGLWRMFAYQSDWKALPMAALIAGLVGMVIRSRMFKNMAGMLMGSFALLSTITLEFIDKDKR